MEGLITALMIGVVLAALTPLAAFATNGMVEAGRRKRAYKRLKDDPYVKKGAKISELQIEGRDTPIMTDCYIRDFKVGYMEIGKVEDGELVRAVTFTGREFEKLIPIFNLRKTPLKKRQLPRKVKPKV